MAEWHEMCVLRIYPIYYRSICPIPGNMTFSLSLDRHTENGPHTALDVLTCCRLGDFVHAVRDDCVCFLTTQKGPGPSAMLAAHNIARGWRLESLGPTYGTGLQKRSLVRFMLRPLAAHKHAHSIHLGFVCERRIYRNVIRTQNTYQR